MINDNKNEAELLNGAWFIYKQNRQLKTVVAMNLIPTY